MVRRNRGSKELSQAEMERFVSAATELHHACCDPRLRIDGPHYRALSDLNQQICDAVQNVTGDIVPWARPALASHYPRHSK